jgi:hypothetical protein
MLLHTKGVEDALSPQALAANVPKITPGNSPMSTQCDKVGSPITFNMPPLPSLAKSRASSDAGILAETSVHNEADSSSDYYDEFCAFIDKNIHLVDESSVGSSDHCGTTTMTLTDFVNMGEAVSHLLLPY